MKLSAVFHFALTGLALVPSATACPKGKREWDSCDPDGKNQCCGVMYCRRYDRVCVGNNRRQLNEGSLWEPEDPCASATYELAVHADDHISLLATPTLGVDCPAVLFDDNVSNESGKRATIADSETKNRFEEMKGRSFTVGMYQFDKVAAAFQDAETSFGQEYDLVHNNCATFVLSMLDKLHYKAGPELMDYVIGELTHSSIPEAIQESPSINALGEVTAGDDLGLMKNLVENYVKQYHANRA